MSKKDKFTTIFASGMRYSKSYEAAKQMAVLVKGFLEQGGEQVIIEVHSKELYELREENEKLRRKLNMEESSYHHMVFCDEEI